MRPLYALRSLRRPQCLCRYLHTPPTLGTPCSGFIGFTGYTADAVLRHLHTFRQLQAYTVYEFTQLTPVTTLAPVVPSTRRADRSISWKQACRRVSKKPVHRVSAGKQQTHVSLYWPETGASGLSVSAGNCVSAYQPETRCVGVSVGSRRSYHKTKLHMLKHSP